MYKRALGSSNVKQTLKNKKKHEKNNKNKEQKNKKNKKKKNKKKRPHPHWAWDVYDFFYKRTLGPGKIEVRGSRIPKKK